MNNIFLCPAQIVPLVEAIGPVTRITRHPSGAVIVHGVGDNHRVFKSEAELREFVR